MDKKQNSSFQTIAIYANMIFKILLYEDDIMGIHKAKKLLHSSEFVYDNATAYLSENNAASAIFIAANLGVITYQYIYASEFMLLLTSVSGVKKLYKFIFKNPIMGIFFFASFYFKMLKGTIDEKRFNFIVDKMGLPKHENFAGQTFMTALVDKLPNTVASYNITGFRKPLKKILKTIAGVLISKEIENADVRLNSVLFKSVHDTDLNNIKNAAVYISSKDIFKEAEMQEYSEFLENNMKSIKKGIKKSGKKKKLFKLELQNVVERKTKTGEIACLNECKDRIKTKTGCYCEGDCGKTFMVGKKSWCYVDPKKCKNGKKLPKHNGYSYDKCKSSKKPHKTCWTGARWKKCLNK